ncbi:hypothetical protein Q9L58_010082 [Maublancomyces gigas]|uniref:Uncharacterized protein n=1 Tax=Discina gigas TaxID=1032678 RepID=A0ABR3G5D0_9PEZI
MSTRPRRPSRPLPPLPNVQTLVAFAAHHISTSTPTTVSYEPIPTAPALLDAIAAICSTTSRTAIALTIDSKLRQVHLLLSQEGVEQPSPRLHTHIQRTWKLLQELSNTAHGPKNSDTRAREIRLYRYLYTFHRTEIAKGFNEWWPKLDITCRKLGRAVRREKSELPRLMMRFQNAVVALRKVVDILGEEIEVKDEEWWEVRCLMEVAAAHKEVLVGRWEECEDWGVGFRDTGLAGPSTARRALENLTALHESISTLTGYASSPTSTTIFTFTIHASLLTCPSRPIPLPADWTPTIRALNPPSKALRRSTVAKELSAAYATTLHGSPHPECNLISYLQSRHSATPPLGYIGMSTPCCLACENWISYYHSCGSHRYGHRKSTGAWSWPWVMSPGVEEPELVEEIAMLCKEYFSDCCRGREVEREEVDEDDLGKRMREMESWWSESEGQCVFGCIRVDRCLCFEVLWGK